MFFKVNLTFKLLFDIVPTWALPEQRSPWQHHLCKVNLFGDWTFLKYLRRDNLEKEKKQNYESLHQKHNHHYDCDYT